MLGKNGAERVAGPKKNQRSCSQMIVLQKERPEVPTKDDRPREPGNRDGEKASKGGRPKRSKTWKPRGGTERGNVPSGPTL